MKTSNTLSVLLVLLAFSLLGIGTHLSATGEDLASSYVGSRLIATGQSSHLYSRSPRIFTDTDDPVWNREALRTGFTSLNLLHPYVQTPLWAWALQPVCTRVSFRTFVRGFEVLLMLCLSGMLWLVARYWTPSLFRPGMMALLCAVLWVTQPLPYALFLAQTHILFLFLSIAALLLAERDRPAWAGVVLALAAVVKITPGFLFFYWLATRRWKAAGSFVAAFVALSALGFVTVGTEVMRAYLHSLMENGNVLLVAFNNQSLAGFLMGLVYPRIEAYKWVIYPLPQALKIFSFSLTVLAALGGGWLDRRQETKTGLPAIPPSGAVFAMLGATVFTPIAWLHYYVLLIVPAMFLIEAYRRDHRRTWLRILLFVLVMNIYPISFGAIGLRHRRFSVVRSQFLAGLLMMGSLAGLSLLTLRDNENEETTASRLQSASVDVSS